MKEGGRLFRAARLAPVLMLVLLALPQQFEMASTHSRREAEALASRFQDILQELAQQAHEVARLADTLPGGPGSGAMFRELARRQTQMAGTRKGLPSLSIWAADGSPLSWAGPAGWRRPEDRSSPGPFHVLRIGTRLHFLAQASGSGHIIVLADRSFGPGSSWNPAAQLQEGSYRQSQLFFPPLAAPAAGTLPLLAPDGSTLGQVTPATRSTRHRTAPSSWPPLWVPGLAGLLLLVMLLFFRERRRLQESPRLGSLLVSSTGIWTLRILGSLLLAEHPDLFSVDLSSSHLFASPMPLGLARSPLDILFTGLAFLGQTALLLRFLAGDKTVAWRRGAGALCGAMALPATIWLVAREALNSQMNLLEVNLSEHFLARSLVQVALLLVLWSPLSLLVPLIRRRAGPTVVKALLTTLPAAAFLVFLILTLSFLSGQKELVEHNLKLQVLDQEDERIHALDESRLALRKDATLPPYLLRELAAGHGDEAAYRLWARTELARLGYRSSLEIFDAQGHLKGHFGIEMPPSVAAGPGLTANLEPVDLEKVLFSTLSQEEEVYTCRWLVMEKGEVVSGLALYVANGFDNVPLLRPVWPDWPTAAEHAGMNPLPAILGEAPVAMVYGADRKLLWTARPDPPPPPPEEEIEALARSGEWRQAMSGGHQVRLFYFRHGDTLFALGHHLPRLTEHLSRLLHLGTFLLLSGGLILLFFSLILLPWSCVTQTFRRSRTAMGSSYARKLGAAMMAASLIPLLLLSLVQRISGKTERRDILFTLGLQSLDVARRVVEDAMAATETQEETPSYPSDDTLFWLSRVIQQDIDLFAGGTLVATSRRGIYTADLLSPLPPAGAYRRIFLGGRQSFLTVPQESNHAPATISGPLGLDRGPPALLLVPLRLQQAEVEARLRESQEQTTLAAAAITLLLMLASVLLGRRMAARVRHLTLVTERLASGETVPRVPAGSSMDEIGRLTGSFNSMAEALAQQRTDLQTRTETLGTILRHAPTGIICMDEERRVTLINAAALDVLQMTGSTTPGRPLAELLQASPYKKELDQMLHAPETSPLPYQAEISPEGGHEARVRAVMDSLPAPAGGRILILEDITETIRSNRLAAWAEMARRIAHEIKNPLTPIRLSAEHLRRVHESGDPRLAEILPETVETILNQVDILRETSSDFSIYARIPVIRRRPVALGPFLAEVLAPYQAAPPPGLQVISNLAADLPVLDLDQRLLRRAVVNLLENALQATSGGGSVTLSCKTRQQGVILEVKDTGHGMDRETCARIFEPDFSTRETGTGLGLAITRRAIHEHGGTIQVASRPGEGTTFTIQLPAAAPASPAAAPQAPV